jgi:hypothetical protein
VAFPQGEQSAGMADDIGVGDGADLPEHGRIAGGGIPQLPKQRLVRCMFRLPISASAAGE